MSTRRGLLTSESVSAGHPDKICDCSSDAVLDVLPTRAARARTRVARARLATDQGAIESRSTALAVALR